MIKQLESAAQSDPKSYWKILDLLKKGEKGEIPQNPIPAHEWVQHFRELFKSNPAKESDDLNILKELETLENTPIFNELSFFITEQEVVKGISELKAGKAPGLDNISSEIIKSIADMITPVLTKTFNLILSSGTYPSTWAEGVITPLHKKGSPKLTDNYRGITIASCLGKLFSIILNTRLKLFIDKHALIDDRQSSHKKGSRTTDNVFVLKTLMEKYCAGKGKLYVSFIDFRKAFDSIWHQALLFKLLQNGIGGPFYNIIRDMYQKTTSCVKLGNKLSSTFPVMRGVRQGDILSPLLFNLYVNDMTQIFQQKDADAPFLDRLSVACLLYADDLVLVSRTAEGLQKNLNRLGAYCKQWKLEVNLSKSKIMCLSRSGELTDATFCYNDAPLEQVQSYCYLGMELSSNCSFHRAEKSMCEKAAKAMFKLKSLLTGTGIQPAIALKLFDQLIRPIALYGSEIWGPKKLILPLRRNHKLSESFSKIACEKLNLSFCRFILGVHKKAQNSAILGELGRYPLGIDVTANCVLYLKHLLSGKTSSLLKDTLLCNSSLPERTAWTHNANKLYHYIFQNCTHLYAQAHTTRYTIKQILVREYNSFWKESISTERKMRTYITFKSHFSMENYLSALTEGQRKTFTRFRISAHNLAIERGRYTRPPTPIEKRTCPHCPDKVEDELHVLTMCSLHTTVRATLFNNVTNLCPMFEHLTLEQKFVYMMTSQGDILKLVASFIQEVNTIRT